MPMVAGARSDAATQLLGQTNRLGPPWLGLQHLPIDRGLEKIPGRNAVNNPVRKRLCEHPEAWLFSSAAFWSGKTDVPITMDATLPPLHRSIP